MIACPSNHSCPRVIDSQSGYLLVSLFQCSHIRPQKIIPQEGDNCEAIAEFLFELHISVTFLNADGIAVFLEVLLASLSMVLYRCLGH
jgi:hypothetical protein